MKRFLKCFSCYLVAVLVVASCVLFPAVGSCAASIPSDMIVVDTANALNTWYWNESGESQPLPSGESMGAVGWTSKITVASYLDGEIAVLRAGTYQVNGNLPIIVYQLPNDGEYPPPLEVQVLYASFDFSTQWLKSYGFNEPIVIPEDGYGYIVYQSFPTNANEVVIIPPTLYESAWDLFVTFIYGDNAQLTPEQNLTLTILATLAALLVVIIPFALVYFILKFIFGWR